MYCFADLRRMVLSVWAKVADVDSLGLELHAPRAFALRCVSILLALDLHARDRIVVEDEFDGLWRYVTEALVPHVHGGTQGHEISVAVIACIVPVWIQCGEAVNQVGAEGFVETEVVDALVLLELELYSVILHPGRLGAEVE